MVVVGVDFLVGLCEGPDRVRARGLAIVASKSTRSGTNDILLLMSGGVLISAASA